MERSQSSSVAGLIACYYQIRKNRVCIVIKVYSSAALQVYQVTASASDSEPAQQSGRAFLLDHPHCGILTVTINDYRPRTVRITNQLNAFPSKNDT
ncbi:MAG TPA: hypothetical protein PLR69_05710, partial [Candidatus Limiplasma sp.]|nr:hypothetical protein [Candidatus Limiplasma sp.]